LRAHTLKVEAAAWLKDVSCVCDQCPGEDEHVQNEVHALLICQDHRVCELRKHFSFLFSPYFEDFSAAQPFLLQQVNNQLVHDFLSQQNNRLFLFLSELMDLFVAGRDQSAADQPNNLKVTPHCNHLIRFRVVKSRALFLQHKSGACTFLSAAAVNHFD